MIKLSLSRLAYSALAGFAQTIHDGFVALVAIFATPNPLMAAFQADIDALNAAIAKWGTAPNTGSKADLTALRDAARVVRTDLRMLAEYAMNTVPDNPSKWIEVGFSLKSEKTKPVVLQAVQNLRHFITRNIPAPQIKIKWKRPLDSQAGAVKLYIVQRTGSPVYPVAPEGHVVVNVVAFTTITEFIDEDPFVGENYYWVTPVNAAGLGVVSDALMVVNTKMKLAPVL